MINSLVKINLVDPHSIGSLTIVFISHYSIKIWSEIDLMYSIKVIITSHIKSHL